ncbi:MAG: fibronectin type III domain-containing protein [Nitrospirae bacterium]|nr:fibronectin type III domain-containing protein [Candidatus Manganitrophaceae bacterium]
MKGIFLLAALLGPTSLVSAQDPLLSWDPSSDANVIGYKIYHGTASQIYTESTYVQAVTSQALSGLAPGVHYFSVTAYDQSGTESTFSNEVSKEIASGDVAASGAESGKPGSGGGGGCAIRPLTEEEGSPLDASEMVVLIAAMIYTAVKKRFRRLDSARIQPLR